MQNLMDMVCQYVSITKSNEQLLLKFAEKIMKMGAKTTFRFKCLLPFERQEEFTEIQHTVVEKRCSELLAKIIREEEEKI